MNKKEAKAIAERLEASYNPYINNSVKHYRGTEELYLFFDSHSYTRDEMKKLYIETATKDIIHGYEDRIVGYYDKWYRYNHADEGRAYDEGVKLATKNPKCKEEFRIIPCC